MTDNELLLQDRLDKIREVINKYGEDNFYISFSGGKDSTVLSEIIDMAIPDNEIPRVYADTGIELNMIRNFVYDKQKIDKRIVIIKPSTPIKKMLEENGYPFKSKGHSVFVKRYQAKGLEYKSVRAYIELEPTMNGKKIFRPCPKKLRYQFTNENKLKISDACCIKLKEEPLEKYRCENGRIYGITGVMRAEGGRRERSSCLAYYGNKLKFFQPLVPITKEWEDWFIDKYNVEICAIYKEPYNMIRTGCKGCPFNIKVQQELDMLEKYFPNERKQCEAIWKPVYDEYRRIGYRLKPIDIIGK